MPRSTTKRARTVAHSERGWLVTVAGWLTQFAVWLLGRMLARPRDSALAIVATVAIAAILINSLYLQTSPHPAPIFALRPLPVASDEPTGTLASVIPRTRPQEAQQHVSPAQSSRPRNEVIADVQRELARRGYYDAAVDGVAGAKTDAAIRDFEQANRLKSSGEPSEALLQAILQTPAKPRTAPASGAARRDKIAGLLEPSQRMSAIQRALSEFGYGPVAVTGVYSPETRAAVERFERTHNLPITGEISERVARELTAMTGRPL